MGTRARSDAGFSLLELLVALALASLVVIAIGGLIKLCLDVRVRVEETTRIEAALLDVRAVAGRLGRNTMVRLSTQSDGFVLSPATSSAGGGGVIAPVAEARLGSGTFTFIDGVAGRTSSVDLAAFEDVHVEYLSVGGQSYAWQRDAGGQAFAAARLTLKLRQRTWLVMLWAIEPSLISSP